MCRPLALAFALALVLASGCAREDAAPADTVLPARPEPAAEAPAARPTAAEEPVVDTDTSLSVEPPPDRSPPTAAERAPDGSAGSCEGRPDRPSCTSYTGPGWGTAQTATECGGRFVAAACPAEGRLATCAFSPNGDPAREVVATFYEGVHLPTAEATCPGTFTPF